MKNKSHFQYLYIYILLFLTPSSVWGGCIYETTKNGNWEDLSVWNITQGTCSSSLPSDGDLILIHHNIDVNTAIDFSNAPVGLYIENGGLLNFASSGVQIKMLTGSEFTIKVGGTLNGNGNSSKIKIGSTKVWQCGGGAGAAISVNCPLNGSFSIGSFALPVIFGDIRTSYKNDNIVIEWTTLNEENNHHFEIQNSVDGLNFTTLRVIDAIGDNQGSAYSFINETSEILSYYRIKQVDIDGNSSYSKVFHYNLPTIGKPYTINLREGNIVFNFDEKIKDESKELIIYAINGSIIHTYKGNQNQLSFHVNSKAIHSYLFRIIIKKHIYVEKITPVR